MRTLLIAAASLLWLGSSTAQFAKCSRGFEPRLARVETGESELQLAEPLAIECSDGKPLILLPRGTRLPASYEDSFLAEKEDAEEVQLHFPDLGLFVSDKLHKWPGGLPHMKAKIRVDEAGLVTLTEWDPDEEIVIQIGTVPVEKAGVKQE
jgi:hypothetical protein